MASKLSILSEYNALTSFILSRPSIGAEDNDGFQLLGCDAKQSPCGLGRDMDTILLTELYEYIILSNPPPEYSQLVAFPHLLLYKLQRASCLADEGYISEAQRLVEAVMSITKGVGKIFQFTPAYLEYIDSVNFRISHSEPSGGSGWFGGKLARPKLDKIWVQSFNKFVAGDDGEQGTPVESENIGGIFKRLASTPSNPEGFEATDASPNTNMYGRGVQQPYGLVRAQSMGSFGPPIAESAMQRNQSHSGLTGFAEQQPYQQPLHNSHYRSQPGNGVVHASEPQIPSLYGSIPSRPQSSGADRKASASSSIYNPYAPAPHSRPGSRQGPGSRGYTPDPYAPAAENGTGSPYSHVESVPEPVVAQADLPYGGSTYMPYGYQNEIMSGVTKEGSDPKEWEDDVPQHTYDNSRISGPGYEREEAVSANYATYDHEGRTGDYESENTRNDYNAEVGYQGYKQESGEDGHDFEVGGHPHKGQDTNNSTDYYSPAAINTPPLVSAIPEENEEDDDLGLANSKKKEEKDGSDVKKKDNDNKEQQQPGRGWFSWLKRGNEDLSQQPKVYKAKLGEELSLVYDPKLKRYINKNASPDELKEAASSLPPPPPKSNNPSSTPPAKPSPKPGVDGSTFSGPPSRVPSVGGAPGGPPSGPPSSGPPSSGPPSNGSPNIGPPSSIGSEPQLKKASTAGGLDDLLAAAPPPGGRKAGRRSAKNRYVDIMNQDTS
jgi:COPII coat assembly protein SEC16